MIDTALQYSGGKDSRAVLHMYKDQLDKIIVVWLDAGASYPRMQDEMRQMCRQVPHFLIVKGSQPKQIAENGYPTDVLPLSYSPLGRSFRSAELNVKLQSTFGCCSANVWQPLQQAMQMLGIKRIIRGQRNDDEYRNKAFAHGAVLDGVECVSPLETWTEKQVFEYLEANKVPVPEYYKNEMTGRDCWNCTGYLSHNVTRIKNLPESQRTEVTRRLKVIRDVVAAELGTIDAAIGAN